MRSFPAFWSGSVWPGWARAEVQEEILWIVLSIIPPYVKQKQPNLVIDLYYQQGSILHARVGSIYIISALNVYTSLLFSDFEPPCSALLCAVLPSCPLATVCALCRAFQGALAEQRMNSLAVRGLCKWYFKITAESRICLRGDGWKRRTKRPFVLNLTTEI